MNIEKRYEERRGCGFRKPGGLYMVSGGQGVPCGILPFELTVCPTCGGGIKFSRGWSWVNNDLFQDAICAEGGCPGFCAPFAGTEPLGLIWVGEKFYHTTEDFNKESAAMGISRRVKAIPQNFKMGETWVLLAHIRAVPHADSPATPGIFKAFKPTAIEYIVKGDESAEELAKLDSRGITLIDLKPAGE